jgi:hypothetical protein
MFGRQQVAKREGESFESIEERRPDPAWTYRHNHKCCSCQKWMITSSDVTSVGLFLNPPSGDFLCWECKNAITATYTCSACGRRVRGDEFCQCHAINRAIAQTKAEAEEAFARWQSVVAAKLGGVGVGIGGVNGASAPGPMDVAVKSSDEGL